MPQCIAKSKRSGARCKNWSMRGKSVCRFHGGKSTGPKTTIGREKIRAASYRHGMRSKESIQHLKEIRRLIQRSKSFLEKV
jgi:hypothetical protein